MSNLFLPNIHNCWRFDGSLSGINGQPFAIQTPAFESAKFSRLGLRLNGTDAASGPAIGSNAAPLGGAWTGILWFKPVTLPTMGADILRNTNSLNGGFLLSLDSAGILSLSIYQDVNTTMSISAAAPLVVNEDALIVFGYNTQTHMSFLRLNNVAVNSPAFTPFPGIPKNIEFGKPDGVVSLLALSVGQNMSPSVFGALWNGGAGIDYPF